MQKLTLIITILFFQFLSVTGQPALKINQGKSDQEQAVKKFERAIDLVNKYYVDSVDNQMLVEQAIIGLLRQLDPHSNYFTADQIRRANEDLEGSFSGIGVEFQIIDDTAVVMSVVSDGPASKAGLSQGDLIIRIGDEDATGSSINNSWVSRRVRGEKGTELIITVMRYGVDDPLLLTVTRDQIPTFSVDAWFMLTPETGYIKVSRFMRTTVPEFEKAISSLKDEGVENLILDLRGNSGGFLNSAVQLSDHFLSRNKVIVYTEGLNSTRFDYKTTGRGQFRKGKLIVLIDERSASASEIVTGAVQDWDRGLVMGRRSFGKGLVQKPYNLPDGSAIRLTIARYYTPVGRSIQRPYEKGRDSYYQEVNEKMRLGIYSNVDSMNLHDSLKFITPNGRMVYGGGGIMPDIIVAADTTGNSAYLSALQRRNMFNRYAIHILRSDNDSLLLLHPDFRSFVSDVQLSVELLYGFTDFAESFGIEGSESEHRISDPVIANNLISTFARLLYGNSESIQFQSRSDILISKALDIIADSASEKNFKLSQE